MSEHFPFWVGQVDTESLPPWCAVVMLVTIVVMIVMLIVALIRSR